MEEREYAEYRQRVNSSLRDYVRAHSNAPDSPAASSPSGGSPAGSSPHSSRSDELAR